MNKLSYLSYPMLLCLSPALAGCAEDGAEGAQTTFTRTAARVGPGGVEVVDVKTMSRQEQEDMIDARYVRASAAGSPVQPRAEATGEAADALVVDPDPYCSDSLWLFDDFEMTGNLLCLLPEWDTSYGYVGNSLTDFPRYLCNSSWCFVRDWSKAVRSYWSGVDTGWFEAPYLGTEWFDPFEAHYDASEKVRLATSLCMPNFCSYRH
jgi:hypothetical protein